VNLSTRLFLKVFEFQFSIPNVDENMEQRNSHPLLVEYKWFSLQPFWESLTVSNENIMFLP
jgi:hypothetical protein